MYSFVKSFEDNFTKNTGLTLSGDDFAYIKSICENTEPYRKIDNKGRDSEYFTFLLNKVLITVVCDAKSKKILTAVIETHNRPHFKKGEKNGN